MCHEAVIPCPEPQQRHAAQRTAATKRHCPAPQLSTNTRALKVGLDPISHY